MAFDGSNFLVAWGSWDGRSVDIKGARVSQSGSVLDPAGFVISTTWTFDQPSVVSDGTNCLIVWYEDYYHVLYGARVNRAGMVLDPAGIAISTTTKGSGIYPAVDFDGINYLVVWKKIHTTAESADIFGARVSQSGAVIDTVGIAIAYDVRGWDMNPSVTFDGSNYFVAWEDLRNGSDDNDLFGAKVSPSGTITDYVTISKQPGEQVLPVVVAGQDGQTLVVYSGWTDAINNHPANTMRIWGKLSPFTGIEERRSSYALRPALRVYPQPAKTFFTVHSPSPVSEIKIYDVSGKLVREEYYPFNRRRTELKIDLTGTSSGIYFLKIKTEAKEFTEKVVVIN